MKSRFLFRENGQVIRTQRGAGLADALFALVAIAMLLGLLAWGHAVDELAQAQDTYEAGLIVGRVQMQQTVADAYRQGQRDAVAAGQACPPVAPLAAPAAPAARAARPLLLSWGGR